MRYDDFLASKRRTGHDHGIGIDPDRLHPNLFGFQQDIISWALRKGRAAIFADTGLGKTRMQIEWARHIADRALIIAPLSVARQTVREAAALDTTIRYVRHADQVDVPGIYATNYEMAAQFNPGTFGAVVLDESSILKNHTGATRTQLVDQWSSTPYRLCCTATPAPNDVAELANHVEFLGLMTRTEFLSAYFVHDDDGWRLKGHAAGQMFDWMTTWATAIRRPSDIGYPDDGYDLPPVTITAETVQVDIDTDGQLFATELGGVGGRHAVRRSTLDARVARTVDLVAGNDDQWIVWCGLNPESDAVTAAVPGAVNVQGSMTPDAKAEALEAFQDGKYRVLVSKPSICGMGMNFQNAHRMAFVGVSDSWESYYQAIRRCYRFGQSRPVDVRIVVSDLELQIVDNLRRKETEAATLVDMLVTRMTKERSYA